MKSEPLSAFPWAVPCTVELAEIREHGSSISSDEYEQMILDLEPQDEPWPPKDAEQFEAWLEAQAVLDEAKLAQMDEVPF